MFDALGRVTSETNVLGAFGYTYDGTTSRLATVTYPNNQTSTYSYLPNNQDHRLQTIHHKYPNATTLSKFDYTYDAVGNILTWRQQADTSAVNWRYGYDGADQLTSAVKESTDPMPVIQKRYAYGYDPAGNRLFEQIDDQVTAASHDNLNRLLTHTPGGPLQFVGTVNEPAIVTVAGQPAMVDPTNAFRGPAPTVAGTTTVSITATDPSGNAATRRYEVDVTGAPKTFAYDANGNMTGDGTRTFEWDAMNQLVAVNVGTQRTEFTYDGVQRRVRARSLSSAVVTDDRRTIWDYYELVEERDVVDGSILLREYTGGYEVAGSGSFRLGDHLMSATEVTTSAGTLFARYQYDPWGRQTVVSGATANWRGFAGQIQRANIGGSLTKFRVYDAELGRWLGEDPLRLGDGPNMYSYVRNAPSMRRDRLGLSGESCDVGMGMDLQKCLLLCDAGKEGARQLCGSFPDPRIRTLCWAAVNGGVVACKGFYYARYVD